MAAKGDGQYTPNKKAGKKNGFDWGDGKGKVHSRPKRTASQLGKAKENKRLDDPGYFTNPQTLRTAIQEAQRAGGIQYGAQQAQIGLQQAQVPEWFNQYRAELQSPAQVAQTYQPMIAQQQAVAQETAKPTVGLDPGSEAGRTDAAAAKAREALVNLGASTLQAQQGADTTYFQGRAPVATAAQIGLQTQLGSQARQVAGERGQFEQQYLTDARTRERAYGLDTQHQMNENAAFNLDVVQEQNKVKNAKTNAKSKVQVEKQKAKAKGKDVNQYGYTNEQWGRFSPSHRQRIMRDQKTSGSGGTKVKEPDVGAKRDLRKAVALVQGKLSGKKSAPDTFWKQAYQALVGERDMDPALARAAIQLVRLGHVGGNTRRTLEEDYGLTSLPKGSKRKKPPAYKVPSRPDNAPGADGQYRPT